MAAGRTRQSRLTIVQQAQVIWAMFGETPVSAYQRFIDSGVLESSGGGGAMPSNPLADKIAADIATSGRLVVDEAKFKRMLDEVTCGKP